MIVGKKPKYKKKRGGKRGKSNFAKKAYYTSRKALKIARKSHVMSHTDKAITAQDVTSTGYIVCLSAVSQGNTEHQRRGEETLLLSSRLCFRLFDSVDQTTNATHVRMMLFRDMEDSSADALPNSIALTLSNSGVLEHPEPWSLVAQDNKKRFIILWDKIYTFNKNYSTARKGICINNLYTNLKKVKASYNNTTSDDLTTGHLYLLVLSDSVNAVRLDAYHRTYFESV